MATTMVVNGSNNGHHRNGVLKNGCDSSSQNNNKQMMGDANKASPIKNNKALIYSLVLTRILVLDLPLTLVFGACGVAFCVQTIYTTYYVPLMERATRTDEQLQEEFTYYHRRCTARDITTQNLSDLVLLRGDKDDRLPESKPQSRNHQEQHNGVDLLMTHGAVVIPQVLSPTVVQNLRDYAVYRNRVIPEHERYPVSQGERRVSFGYDATEHPAVAQAVQQVATHPIVQDLLQRVLGDHDPASTEITTITQYYGAPPQVWHSDTKEDGNALKFARTYSHSYSLFLPLQNITQNMGATDLCPGTHYCANDLHGVCDQMGQGLHTAHTDHVFRAGDGVLLNQHVWHRGAAHRDPHAPERVVFIMSFIARPRVHPGDTRQLSRGTYFHQKWNMWGHTLQDAQDPLRFMARPFSLLKCLSLWTWHGHWGYDLVTATYMRFSNAQLGNDLTRLVEIWDTVLEWPEWLHGRNLEYEVEEKVAWQVFVQETIGILTLWVHRVALAFHLLYFVVGGVWLLLGRFRRPQRRRGHVAAAFKRILVGHGLIIVTFYWILHRIRYSLWGQDVIHGRALMRPFPPVSMATKEELDTLMLSSGPTTYPSTWDVLQGTRLDAPWLGAYEQWLEGHPGNQKFRTLVQALAPFYPTTTTPSGLSVALSRELIYRVIQHIKGNNGRFLLQDYRNGDWRVQTSEEVFRDVQLELACASSPHLAVLRTTLDRSIAIYRFGTTLRSTALARKSVLHLWRLRQRLILRDSTATKSAKTTTSRAKKHTPNQFLIPRTRPLPIRPLPAHCELRLRPSLPPLTEPKRKGKFQVGQPVWILLSQSMYGEREESWFRGDVLSQEASGASSSSYSYTVALETGAVHTGVPPGAMAKYKPPQAGDTVMGCFSYDNFMMMQEEEELDEEEEPFLLDDCYEGQIVRVMPDGSASILYNDGDYEFRKPAGQYYLPPYVYVLPDGQ